MSISGNNAACNGENLSFSLYRDPKLKLSHFLQTYKLTVQVRSKIRSSWKSRKPRRIFFRGFPLRVFHFALYPKPKTRRRKPWRFSLRHFDQTLRYFDQTPRFSISEFSVWRIAQKRNLGVGKTRSLIKMR